MMRTKKTVHTHDAAAEHVKPRSAELEAGLTYDMRQALAHAAAKRKFVAKCRPADWAPPSILKVPELLTEKEVVLAGRELKALQRHAFEIVASESG